MANIKERLLQVAKSQDLSIRAFEEKCGLGRGNISNMGEASSIGSDKLTKIIDTFPEIDLYWLLLGVGDMLRHTHTPTVKEQTNDPAMIDKLLEQAKEIGRLEQRIKELEQRLEKDATNAYTGGTANVG